LHCRRQLRVVRPAHEQPWSNLNRSEDAYSPHISGQCSATASFERFPRRVGSNTSAESPRTIRERPFHAASVAMA
jgi:hypothetical protein